MLSISEMNLFGYSITTGQVDSPWERDFDFWGMEDAEYESWCDDYVEPETPWWQDLAWDKDEESVPSFQSQRAPKVRHVQKEWQVEILGIIPPNKEWDEPAMMAVSYKFGIKPERKFKAKPAKKVVKATFWRDDYVLVRNLSV